MKRLLTTLNLQLTWHLPLQLAFSPLAELKPGELTLNLRLLVSILALAYPLAACHAIRHLGILHCCR